jgi:hypothetical protein
MKTKIKTIAILALVILFTLNSCKREEPIPKPEIDLTELGLDNSKIGYIGSDLHVEADIVAEGTIESVEIEIHPEEAQTWEFDSVYTEFSGLKNTLFHKHIDIPATAEAGDYHFHFTVSDKEGNQTLVESEMEIQEPTDLVAPEIVIGTAPTNGQSFSTGETILITGTITDDVSLGGIYIGLVGEDQALGDAEVNADNTITLLHHHDFANPTSYTFTGSIVVGAATDNDGSPDPITWTPGNYYILVKCTDAFGGNWTFSSHYPVEIN